MHASTEIFSDWFLEIIMESVKFTHTLNKAATIQLFPWFWYLREQGLIG